MTLSAALIALLAGCSAGPSPESPPPGPRPVPAASRAPSAIVSGASDTVTILPGSPAALYRYRFKQTDPPSDKFQYRDRELSFYMRPTPAAIHFQIENLQDRPTQIDWDRSQFVFMYGRTGRIAHAPSTWREQYSAPAPTMINGLGRYSDYVFPAEYLVDDAGSGQQLHRMLLPEDESAPQYTDAEFGMDLVFLIEGQPRTYSFRFKVASVLPR